MEEKLENGSSFKEPYAIDFEEEGNLVFPSYASRLSSKEPYKSKVNEELKYRLAGKELPFVPLDPPWFLIDIGKDELPREAFPEVCKKCKDEDIQKSETEVRSLKETINGRKIKSVDEPQDEISVEGPENQYQKCLSKVNNLLDPSFSRGREVLLFLNCPKNRPSLGFSEFLYIPTMFQYW